MQGTHQVSLEKYWVDEPKNNPQKTNSAASRKEQKRIEAELRKKLQPLQKNINKLDKQLDTLHKQQSKMEELLADPDIYNEQNKSKLSTLLADKGNVDKQIESNEDEWMDLSEQLETLKKP